MPPDIRRCLNFRICWEYLTNICKPSSLVNRPATVWSIFTLALWKREIGVWIQAASTAFQHRPLLVDQRGSMAILAAGGIVVALGAGALAVDLGRAHMIQSELQSTADAAALAAATRLPDRDAARKHAVAYARKNMPPQDYGEVLRAEDVVFGTWNSEKQQLEDGKDGNAVRVTVRIGEANKNALATLFAPVFGLNHLDIAESATAASKGAPCVMALGKNNATAMIIEDATFNLINCGAQVNSTDAWSTEISGKSVITANSLCSSGGVTVDAAVQSNPYPSEYCPQILDPLVGQIWPTPGPCTETGLVIENQITSLSPGTYCGGVTVQGTSLVTLQPGNYFIKDGLFSLTGTSVLAGMDVSIFMTGALAQIKVEGNSLTALSATSAGPLKGMLIVQMPDAVLENKWNSTLPSIMTGVLYMPNGKFHLDTEINVATESGCFVVIADEIHIHKGPPHYDTPPTFKIDLSAPDCRGLLPAAFSRSAVLVE